jgi:HK97 family phage major capsid protein
MLNALRQKRAKALSDAQAIDARAHGENRDINAEERAQFEAFMADYTALGDQIQRKEMLERETLRLAELTNEQVDLNSGVEHRSVTPESELRARQYKAYEGWLRSGQMGPEFRALQVDQDVTGGYLQTPQQMVTQLLKAVDNQVFMRQLGTVYRVPNAESLGVPSLDADPADPTRTTEILSGDEDSTMALGKRKLTPTPYAIRLKSSQTLLRKVPSAGALIEERLAYKMAVVDENAFMNGDGGDSPLGVFTASANGVPTTRDYNTDMTTTAPTFDGLLGMKYTLNEAYWGNAGTRWIFHPDCMLKIAKIKDGEGRYLLRENVASGEGDTIFGIPVALSRYAPNTFTAGLYFGILGDLSYYWIADALDLRIQRVNELYAATDQVGFFARAEDDGMPVLAEAFVRGKLAS